MKAFLAAVCVLQTWTGLVTGQHQRPSHLMQNPSQNQFIREQQLRRFFEDHRNMQRPQVRENVPPMNNLGNRPPPFIQRLPILPIDLGPPMKSNAALNRPPFVKPINGIPQINLEIPGVEARVRKGKGCGHGKHQRPQQNQMRSMAEAVAKAVQQEVKAANRNPNRLQNLRPVPFRHNFRQGSQFNRPQRIPTGPIFIRPQNNAGKPAQLDVPMPANPFILIKQNPKMVRTEGHMVGPALYHETSVIIEDGPEVADDMKLPSDAQIIRQIELKPDIDLISDLEQIMLVQKFMEAFVRETKPTEVKKHPKAKAPETKPTDNPSFHLKSVVEEPQKHKTNWFALKVPVLREYTWRHIVLFSLTVGLGLLTAAALLTLLMKKKGKKSKTDKKHKKSKPKEEDEISIISKEEGFANVPVHAFKKDGKF